jgi:hypothetical protein
MLAALLAATALLAALTSRRLVLLAGFLLTALLAALLLLAALFFATHRGSPLRNNFRVTTIFSRSVGSFRNADLIVRAGTKQYCNYGVNARSTVPRNNVEVPHEKCLTRAIKAFSIENWTDTSANLKSTSNGTARFFHRRV